MAPPSRPFASQAAAGIGLSKVRELPFVGDEATLLARLRDRHPAAVAAFYDRYANTALRVLARILGADRELEDLHHEVFVAALGSVGGVRQPERLESWVVGVAVRVARGAVRRRARRKWLVFLGPEATPDPPASGASPEAVRALRAAYAVLDEMPADERIAFALRFIDGMDIEEVRRACGISRATVHRRLARARTRFLEGARNHAALADWIERVKP